MFDACVRVMKELEGTMNYAGVKDYMFGIVRKAKEDILREREERSNAAGEHFGVMNGSKPWLVRGAES